MRRIVVVIALTIVSRFVFAQTVSMEVASNTTSEVSPVFLKNNHLKNYEIGNPPGLKKRNTGRTLTILGGGLLIGGIAVFSSADEKYYSSTTTNGNTQTEGDPKAGLGILMIAGGIGMTIPGIILWTKGEKQYKQHLQNEGAQATIQFKGNGLSLKYRF
ncbi:MAG TPA: hypothetical protein PLJ60_08910 [Chryseolinea sp.]|nr:hypothetical protein [Chryseolinea sp.]HPH46796.1 hypothetical protein [Chryseolinea sp.]HPM30446.1 hypothetical protein [Chryseolinea sp.]